MRSQGAYFGGIIVLCTMFLISCIFFNKCLYFSHYMAGYLLERHHTGLFFNVLGFWVYFFLNLLKSFSFYTVLLLTCSHLIKSLDIKFILFSINLILRLPFHPLFLFPFLPTFLPFFLPSSLSSFVPLFPTSFSSFFFLFFSFLFWPSVLWTCATN